MVAGFEATVANSDLRAVSPVAWKFASNKIKSPARERD